MEKKKKKTLCRHFLDYLCDYRFSIGYHSSIIGASTRHCHLIKSLSKKKDIMIPLPSSVAVFIIVVFSNFGLMIQRLFSFASIDNFKEGTDKGADSSLEANPALFDDRRKSRV